MAAHHFLYFAPVLLQAIVGIASVPVLIDAVGIEDYPYVASGQAIGAVTWILLSFGYQATGPTRLAMAPDETLRSIFSESIRNRLMVAPAVLGAAVTAAWVVDPGHLTLAAGFAVPMALGGLTSAWLFVAAADPLGALRYEAVPRLLPSVAGLVATFATGRAEAFIVGQVAGVGWSVLATARYAYSRSPRPTAGPHHNAWRAVLPRQARMAALTTVAATSAALPLLILTARSYAVRFDFAVLDKFHKQATGAMVPVSSALLSGLGLRPADDVLRLARRNARVLCLLFATIAVCMALVAGPAAALLSSGEVHLSAGGSGAVALWISATGLAQAWVPCVLAPAGRDRLGLAVIVVSGAATALVVAVSPSDLGLTPILLSLSAAQFLLPVLTWPRQR